MKTFRILFTVVLLPLAAALLAPGLLRAQDDTTITIPTDTMVPADSTTPADTTPPADTTTPADTTAPADATAPADTTATDDTSAGATPSFDYFYDALQPYGQWIQVEGYGPCWQPNAAQDPNWQPYTDGYWAYTDAGWTWVSYEDFGWITYHYGRWAQVQDAGWVWVPDYQWAPAWVSWRASRNLNTSPDTFLIGWAPLPPECHFRADIGISSWVDAACDIGPGCYTFCRLRDFGAPVLGPVLIDRSKNVFILNTTANITNITTSNNIVYNGGPDYQFLSKRVNPRHPIPVLQLVRQTNAGLFRKNGPKGMLAHSEGRQLFMAAPLIAPPKQEFKPAKVAKVFDKPVINKGWAGVDPKQKLQLQAAIKAQTKGVKLTPARPVTAQQLAVVPKAGPPVPSPGPRPGGTPPGRTPFRLQTPPPGASPGKPTPPPPSGIGTMVSPAPSPSPGGKPGRKPFVTPGPVASPAPTGRPGTQLTPFNPNATATPHAKFNTPPPKLNTPPPNFPTPPPRPTPPKLNTPAANLATPPPRPTPPPFPPRPIPPPQPSRPPQPPGPGPVFPGKSGRPTPTPTPTPGH